MQKKRAPSARRARFRAEPQPPSLMSTLTAPSTNSHRLSEAQKKFYADNGSLLGLPPIYTREEMAKINAELPNLLALLQPGETTKDIREWHEASTYLFEIAMNPKILDLVEEIGR